MANFHQKITPLAVSRGKKAEAKEEGNKQALESRVQTKWNPKKGGRKNKTRRRKVAKKITIQAKHSTTVLKIKGTR